MVAEFYPDKAPNHVRNFKWLANNHFYDGVTFHRIIKGFMLQGGDPTGTGSGGPGWTVNAEFNDIKHTKGILSMARSSDPNSAGSQFFVMDGTTPHLDGQYSAFGKVIKGLDVIDKVTAVVAAHPPELAQRAHDLLNAPHIFGMEVGFNLPAFVIALVITAILVIGIRESARFNATIVVIKVSVVLFVIALGSRYVNSANWGHGWSEFAPYGFSGIGAGAAYIFFAYIGFDAVSTTAQEAKNPQRDLPIGIIASLLICTVFYIAVAAVLTGMVPWREINIEAPIARAFLDRGLTTASHVITLGALAGLTSVMLVMLLGQTRVLYSMAYDGLLPKKFFADIHPKFRTPWKNTILVGFLAAFVGSTVPIDDIGKMVNIGTLLAFVIVCIAVLVLRRSNPGQHRPFRTPWVPIVPILGIGFNGYMMYKLGWINWARLIIWLIIGMVIYFTYSRHHSRVQMAQSESKGTAMAD